MPSKAAGELSDGLRLCEGSMCIFWSTGSDKSASVIYEMEQQFGWQFGNSGGNSPAILSNSEMFLAIPKFRARNSSGVSASGGNSFRQEFAFKNLKKGTRAEAGLRQQRLRHHLLHQTQHTSHETPPLEFYHTSNGRSWTWIVDLHVSC